jgi:hypothetical protein
VLESYVRRVFAYVCICLSRLMLIGAVHHIVSLQCSAVHRWINEWMDVSFISLSTRYVCAVVSNYSSID